MGGASTDGRASCGESDATEGRWLTMSFYHNLYPLIYTAIIIMTYNQNEYRKLANLLNQSLLNNVIITIRILIKQLLQLFKITYRSKYEGP